MKNITNLDALFFHTIGGFGIGAVITVHIGNGIFGQIGNSDIFWIVAGGIVGASLHFYREFNRQKKVKRNSQNE